MNEEGSFYIGTTVFDLRTGEQFAIPLEADNEPGSVTNQIFNSVVVKSSLALNDGAGMYFGNDTNIYFDSSTSFNTTTGPITASQTPLPEVYASTAKAGLVQLADDSVIRGALGSGSQGIAERVVVTAAGLAKELTARFDNTISQGTGVIVSSSSVELPGGDPNSSADNITQFLVSVNPAYSGFTPVGGIIMWSGSIAEAAELVGWKLCDGTNGTPDLRERFIVGAGGDNPSVAGTTGYTSGANGGVNSVVLDITQIPPHTHGFARSDEGVDSGGATVMDGPAPLGQGVAGSDFYPQVVGGSGTPPVTQAHENRPPYFALAFIKRIS